ncbi:DUF6869 domain-containing protein [Kangiella sediminilitoris]|uniref:DUF6869 domain-containing protein n=1 Tax=Kangiella sediminilitoris TaxID=1144748 RepID=UPI00083DDA75|nr:hypothetical protein [Kangiella sediminilitoris]
MTKIELETIANDFIQCHLQAFDGDIDELSRVIETSPFAWADDLILSITISEPEKLWDIILAILAKDPPMTVLSVLAAGPLEDYLATNIEAFISKVETQAKKDPKFAFLLGGVWKNAMTDETLARVQKVWSRSGWDGTHE